jgi:hypothetical protein
MCTLVPQDLEQPHARHSSALVAKVMAALVAIKPSREGPEGPQTVAAIAGDVALFARSGRFHRADEHK